MSDSTLLAKNEEKVGKKPFANLIEGIKNFFKNPKEGFQNFWKFLKKQNGWTLKMKDGSTG